MVVQSRPGLHINSMLSRRYLLTRDCVGSGCVGTWSCEATQTIVSDTSPHLTDGTYSSSGLLATDYVLLRI